MRPTATVLVYSDDVHTREQVRMAGGTSLVPRDGDGSVRAGAETVRLEYVECATLPAVLSTLEQRRIDVCVLDGESAPAGGMGVCRQIKDEIFQCPPVLLLIGRPQDAWLATWSRAEAAVSHPVDPVALADALAGLLPEGTGGPEETDGAVTHGGAALQTR